MQPSARAATAAFLRDHQHAISRRVAARGAGGENEFDFVLELVAAHIADARDRRCFAFVRERAQAQFRHAATPASGTVMQVVALYRLVVTQMLRRAWQGEPALLESALALVELVSSEFEVVVAAAYQSSREETTRAAETKYYSLFENASEAILSFAPQGDGAGGAPGEIVEANMQCERLLAQSRAALLGRSFADLFAPEYQDQARWLAAQPGGTSNLRLEDMAVRRDDGVTIPISLSCNWIEVEGAPLAQVIIRDVTPLRQMQRELHAHAEQLEARVAARTHELQHSEERYRALFLQEQRRAQHLSLINDVQQCALVTRETDEFLHQVVAAVQMHFRECDVTFYLCRDFDGEAPDGLVAAANRDGERENDTLEAQAHGLANGSNVKNVCGEMVVVAQVGGYGMGQPVGAAHPIYYGLPGHTALHEGSLYIANDTSLDARYRRAPGVHIDALSQMCVPVAIDSDSIGVIVVSSPARHTFDPRDAVALQTAATIVAAHLQSSRMYREMAELKEFNETLVGTMLHSLMVVNREGIVQLVNERLSQTLRMARSALINRPIADVMGGDFALHEMQSALEDVTENGEAREIPEFRIWSSAGEFIFDVRLSRVFFRGQAHAVVLLINLTQRWRKTQQLQLMNEMGRFLQSSLDVNTVLHTVLTCITAGPALGFNRAFLLLLNDDNSSSLRGATLQGAMALGPSSAEEADAIWREMGRREMSLHDILADNTGFDSLRPSPLQRQIQTLQIPLSAKFSPALEQSVRERRALKVSRDEILSERRAQARESTVEFDRTETDARDGAKDARSSHNIMHDLAAIFKAPEVVVAPLIAKSRIVGVVVADNLYSQAPIEDDDVRLLETVAQQAALTIDNALTYQALHKAQNELVSAERLVAVGEMAARVSHEIRNPLATIGGWARSILKKPDDSAGVRRKISIITDEVSRLEELLTDLLDMARPRDLVLEPQSINEIVEHALLLAEADIKASGVTLEQNLALNLPSALLDRRRVLQALLNTLRNGAQAMVDGGILGVETRLLPDANSLQVEVRDTGAGIPQRALKQIFDPFFSTKIRGSGLGLAVTLRIIRDHNGTIEVFSDEGKGTRFLMTLPLKPPVASDD